MLGIGFTLVDQPGLFLLIDGPADGGPVLAGGLIGQHGLAGPLQLRIDARCQFGQFAGARHVLLAHRFSVQAAQAQQAGFRVLRHLIEQFAHAGTVAAHLCSLGIEQAGHGIAAENGYGGAGVGLGCFPVAGGNGNQSG